jgi:hypothetical protein
MQVLCCCFTTELLLNYCCFTAALLLLYCCFTAALLLLYCCFTAALLLQATLRYLVEQLRLSSKVSVKQ